MTRQCIKKYWSEGQLTTKQCINDKMTWPRLDPRGAVITSRLLNCNRSEQSLVKEPCSWRQSHYNRKVATSSAQQTLMFWNESHVHQLKSEILIRKLNGHKVRNSKARTSEPLKRSNWHITHTTGRTKKRACPVEPKWHGGVSQAWWDYRIIPY